MFTWRRPRRRGGHACAVVKRAASGATFASPCHPYARHWNTTQRVLNWSCMLRISKLTDYATVILAALATEPDQVRTATALAEQTRIAAPTVSKLLKQLQRAGLVASTRGLHGGYQLAKPATQISAAAILDALEGPVALTDCSVGHGNCEIEASCRVGKVWQRLNLAIRRSLYEVSLAQLAGLDPTQVRLPELEREMKTAATRGGGRPGVNRHE